MKKTKRKAFNFLRSYFDVLNKLQTDEDKLSFLLAVINKQFLDENPIELQFPVDLAYDSQFNAIDSSVKGWMRSAKTDLQGNPLDTPPTPSAGKTQTTPRQEKEKEKEKEKEEVQYVVPELDEFLAYAKSVYEEQNKDFSNYKFSVENKYESWKESNWKDGNGKAIKNWKSKFKNTMPHLRAIYPDKRAQIISHEMDAEYYEEN